jgi:hypothetical protein
MDFSLPTLIGHLFSPFLRLQWRVKEYRRTQDFLKGLRCVQASDLPVPMTAITDLHEEFCARDGRTYVLPTLAMIRSLKLGDSSVDQLKKTVGIMSQEFPRAPLWRREKDSSMYVPYYPLRRWTGQTTPSRKPERCLLYFFYEDPFPAV